LIGIFEALAVNRFLFLFLISICLFMISCREGRTDELSFLNPLLVKGLRRPTPPDGLTSAYDPVLQYLCVRWNPSTDPDTGREVIAYRLYLYFVYPPAEFFRREDLLEEVSMREHCFRTDTYTGMLTFVVTGYDGLAESLPSAPLVTVIP
jgi:hypothetical protein